AATRRRRGRSRALPRLDPDEIAAPCGHAVRREAEAEAERLRRVAEDAALVVEAVAVVRGPDRVGGQELWAPPLGRLAHRRREVRQALDQLLLLVGERAGRVAADVTALRIALD